MSATPPLPEYQPIRIPNYLAWTIIATIFATCLCCGLGIIGVVGIVYAAQVDSKLRQGDVEGARRASEAARVWAWITTVMAIIGVFWMAYSLIFTDWQAALEQMQHYQ